jgi:DNA-binding NtrC family response regulator
MILLVDEEATIRAAVADHLRDAGFDVMEAEDTDAAMAFLEGRESLQGLVTDAHVPGRIDGFELAGAVRERWPALAVIMMSGHSDEVAGPVPDGAEFIAKPYLQNHLVPVLNRLLGRAS